MRSFSSATVGIAWALSCPRAAGQHALSAARRGGPAANASAASLPVAPTASSPSERPASPPGGNASSSGGENEGLLLEELQAERVGLRRRGIMTDQVLLSLLGLAGIAVLAAGGVYRYRQRRTTGPSPQVLGRLLEEHEMTNGFGNAR
mmetsp:Transcript_58654/g.162196  ORF Transcript_58654/g.162196 Transcript_58654/m.162196 type:complete len:148 (-) Transcript_58654:128-571(-)